MLFIIIRETPYSIREVNTIIVYFSPRYQQIDFIRFFQLSICIDDSIITDRYDSSERHVLSHLISQSPSHYRAARHFHPLETYTTGRPHSQQKEMQISDFSASPQITHLYNLWKIYYHSRTNNLLVTPYISNLFIHLPKFNWNPHWSVSHSPNDRFCP